MATTSQLAQYHTFACYKQLELKECSQEHSATHKEFIFASLHFKEEKHTHMGCFMEGQHSWLCL
jgi:hypothetical protein